MSEPGELFPRETKVYEQDGYTVTVSKGTPGVVAKIEQNGVMVGCCYDFWRNGQRYFASTEIGFVTWETLKEAVAATIRNNRPRPVPMPTITSNEKMAPMPRITSPYKPVDMPSPNRWHRRKDFD